MRNLPKNLEGMKFEYIQGIRFSDGAERVYQNKKIGIQINLSAPYKNFEWGEGVKSYSIIGSKDFYDSYEDLIIKLENKGE